jgi:hypothetical protein
MGFLKRIFARTDPPPIAPTDPNALLMRGAMYFRGQEV